MKVYLASTYLDKSRMKQVADEIRRLGHVVTSSWLEQPYATSVVDESTSIKCAGQDIADIHKSDTFILFTDSPLISHKGGRHVELGIALSLRKEGIMWIIVVGKYENIFQYGLSRFDTWEECKASLKTVPVDIASLRLSKKQVNKT